MRLKPAAALVLAVLGGSALSAEGAVLTGTISLNGGPAASVTFSGPVTDPTTGQQVYQASNVAVGDGVLNSWSITTGPGSALGSAFALTAGTGLGSYSLTLKATLQPDFAVIGPSLLTASTAGSLTDFVGAPGASLTSAAGGPPVFVAAIDGATQITLLNSPVNVSAGAYGSAAVPAASAGVPVPVSGPALNANLSITHAFTVSPGDLASFTSQFNVSGTQGGPIVPEPVGTTLLAGGSVALLMSRRRRGRVA